MPSEPLKSPVFIRLFCFAFQLVRDEAGLWETAQSLRQPPDTPPKGKRVWRDLGTVTVFQRAISSGFWEKEQGSRERWGRMCPGAGC